MTKKQRVIPRLKPVPYTVADLTLKLQQPQLSDATSVYNNNNKNINKDISGENEHIRLFSTPDLPNNKRGFKYLPCRPNPYLESNMYSTTEAPPHGVHWSYFDRSPEMYVSSDMSIVGTQETDGWRSTRANLGIREGSWYIEYKIVNGINNDEQNESEEHKANGSYKDSSTQFLRSATPSMSLNLSPHIRIGVARREASLEAPVGFDGYGYGVRDINCEKIHLSRRSEFEVKIGGKYDSLKVDDVIGFLVELPSMKVQKNIAKLMILQKTLSDPEFNEYSGDDSGSLLENTFVENGVVREMIPIKYKSELFFEEYEYTPSKAMEHLLNPVTVFGEHAIPDKERFQPAKLPNSSITVYVNGECKGRAFENLLAFLPPASEQRMARNIPKSSNKKIREDQFYVDRDDGELGYYPMVSCFRGGAVQINTTESVWVPPTDLKQKLDSGVIKPYGERAKYRIVEEYTSDLIDDVVNKYLDRMEILIQ